MTPPKTFKPAVSDAQHGAYSPIPQRTLAYINFDPADICEECGVKIPADLAHCDDCLLEFEDAL